MQDADQIIRRTPDASGKRAFPRFSGGHGLLKGVCPEENRHAFIFAIARDIKKGEPDSILLQWRNIALSTYIEFRPTISAQLKNKQTTIPIGP